MKLPSNMFVVFALSAIIVVLAALFQMDQGAPPVADLTKRGGVERAAAHLIIPVAGLTRADLRDTWGEARSEGRRHEGIDIIAPREAAVLAATDGRIVKFFDSVRGGITIYQFDEAERFVYYYAHLDRRAPRLSEGDRVAQGDVIGYVGMSGNAPVPHLHFEIQRLTAEREWWVADSLNPYPHLVSGRLPG